MKITKITTSTLNVPNGPPVSEYYAFNSYIVARIETDQDLRVGYGKDGCSARCIRGEVANPQLSGDLGAARSARRTEPARE